MCSINSLMMNSDRRFCHYQWEIFREKSFSKNCQDERIFLTLFTLVPGCSTAPVKPEIIGHGDYEYTKQYISWLIEKEMKSNNITGLSIALVDDQRVSGRRVSALPIKRTTFQRRLRQSTESARFPSCSRRQQPCNSRNRAKLISTNLCKPISRSSP